MEAYVLVLFLQNIRMLAAWLRFHMSINLPVMPDCRRRYKVQRLLQTDFASRIELHANRSVGISMRLAHCLLND